MDSITKRNAALKLLKTTGIWESNYAPLGVKVLWQLGFNCPPPHLASFFGNALVAGIYFAVAWGLIMSFFSWPQNTFSVTGEFVRAIGAGTFFGAVYGKLLRFCVGINTICQAGRISNLRANSKLALYSLRLWN